MRAAVLIVMCVATVAYAAPLAQIDRDIDGDGVADRVAVHADGTIDITTKAGTQHLLLGTPVTRAAASSAVIQTSAGSTPMVVVEFAGPRGDETIVYALHGTWQEEVPRQKTGVVGTDGEYSIVIGPADNGIYRYQSRPGLHRCDGKPAFLFAEGWKDKKFQRLSTLPSGVAPNALVIAAHVDSGAAPTPVEFQARAASYVAGASDASALAIPIELDDGKATTFWREELAKSDGEGQFFTFEPRFAGARAAQLRVVAGNHTSAATLKQFNRPKRLGVVTAHDAWHVDLPDAATEPLGTAFVADLPASVDGCVTIVLESVYAGTNGNTAISELEVFADGERNGGGEVALARVVAEGKDGSKSAAQALSRRGAAGAAAIETELAKHAGTGADAAGARTRLVRALVDIRDPAAGPLLARAIVDGNVEAGELERVLVTLGDQGFAQELHDLAAKHELASDVRAGAARALARAIAVKPGEAKLAIELAGDGPREVRHAVIETLTALPMTALLAAAQADVASPVIGDVWRAVTRRAHATPAERGPALAAMTAALPATTDYERRYRLVDGIAALGDATALRALTALLGTLPATAERAAFEQVAARAIAVNPRPEALDVLVELASAPDPGVRYAAISALGSAEGGTAGPWHAATNADGIDRVIQTALASDTWPEVRARAAQMLGARCSRIGPARSLADAIGRDPTLTVRGDALAALVECKANGTAALLAKTWDNAKQPIELRQRAIDLSVGLGDRALAATLVGKLAAWRGAALESEAALALAQNAAYAIGRLAPPGAADALLDALAESAYPEIVAAAATGLGLLGPACPAEARTRLRTLAHSDEQQVQLAASRAAAQCGK